MKEKLLSFLSRRWDQHYFIFSWGKKMNLSLSIRSKNTNSVEPHSITNRRKLQQELAMKSNTKPSIGTHHRSLIFSVRRLYNSLTYLKSEWNEWNISKLLEIFSLQNKKHYSGFSSSNCTKYRRRLNFISNLIS